MKTSNKVFFNGLNELRAFAAFAVLLHHIELFKNRDGIGSLFDYFNYFIGGLGKKGVYLFFVLSGFLITYLLLSEKTKFSQILFRKFYMRRVLRIWPLYYIVIAISLFLMPFLVNNFVIFQSTPYYYSAISDPTNLSLETVLLYLIFLPNLALKLGHGLVGSSQAWSVGVEEQFYILWPLLIHLFTGKWIIRLFVVILVLFAFSNLWPVFSLIKFVVRVIPFEFMAIGSIGGYLYFFFRDKLHKICANPYLYVGIIIVILVLSSFSLVNSYLQDLVLGGCFLVLILTSINDSNPLIFRSNMMSYLGKISYGIYMYHPFVMFLVFPFANTFLLERNNLAIYNLAVYLLVIFVTLVISHFSYKYIESYFIRMKDLKFKSI